MPAFPCSRFRAPHRSQPHSPCPDFLSNGSRFSGSHRAQGPAGSVLRRTGRTGWHARAVRSAAAHTADARRRPDALWASGMVVLARELTKIHETVSRGWISELLAGTLEERGEYVILVSDQHQTWTILNSPSLMPSLGKNLVI